MLNHFFLHRAIWFLTELPEFVTFFISQKRPFIFRSGFAGAFGSSGSTDRLKPFPFRFDYQSD